MTLIKQQPTPVTLIGHSMAGLVIAQIAEMIPDHIHELIFIAAYIPQNQESLLSIAAKSDSHAVSPLLIIDQKQREIRLKATKKLTDVFFNRCSKQDAASAIAKLQPQPLQPFSATVTIGANFSRIPKRAFICNYDKALVVSDQLRMSKIVTDNIIYLDSDHAAYYSGESAIIAALL